MGSVFPFIWLLYELKCCMCACMCQTYWLMVTVLCSPPPGSWSASTSPARSPSPSHGPSHGPSPRYNGHRYGTTSLEQRSRSPSPGTGARNSGGGVGAGVGSRERDESLIRHHGGLDHIRDRDRGHLAPHHHHHHLPRPPSGAMPAPHGFGPHGGQGQGHIGPPPSQLRPQQHSYPVLVTRRGQGRRLPPTPSKPSTLQLRPAPINFPQLNASPTHYPLPLPPPLAPQREPVPAYCPLSFEQAVAIGRGGRLLPSPVPNGYKPGPGPGQAQPPPHRKRSRHSDSDDDDWC